MTETKWPIVQINDDGIRPGGPADQCFYCWQTIGQPHKRDCVMVEKKVRVRYIFELEIEVPHGWTKETFEFHRNESGWCADNSIDELEALAKDGSCLCDAFRAEWIGVTDETPIQREGRTPEQMAMDAAIRKETGRQEPSKH